MSNVEVVAAASQPDPSVLERSGYGRPCALLLPQDLIRASPLLDEVRRRYDVRTVVCPSLPRAAGKGDLLRAEAWLLVKLSLLYPFRIGRGARILCGWFPGHFTALAIARFRMLFDRRLEVFLCNFYLHEAGENALVKRLLAFLLSERVVIAAQSPADLAYFRALSDKVRLVLVPYGQDPVSGVTEDDVRTGDYVFAGGYVNRDYDSLLRCARELADLRFVIACSSRNRITEPVPENVVILRDLDGPEFHRLLAGSRLVVVPLADVVGSAGQMVTLAAMQLRKPLIVPDSPVVTQYVEDGRSGIVYEPASDTALLQAMVSALQDEERLASFASEAYDRYIRLFTKAQFDSALAAAFSATELPTAPLRWAGTPT